MVDEDRELDREEAESGEKGVVSVRGVDKSLYRRISSLAKELDTSVGEIVNEALELFIKVTDGTTEKIRRLIRNSYVVKDVDEFEVSGDELLELDKPVVFMDIGELILRDVDDDALDNVVKIINVDKVVVYGQVNRIKLFSKLSEVGEVEVKD